MFFRTASAGGKLLFWDLEFHTVTFENWVGFWFSTVLMIAPSIFISNTNWNRYLLHIFFLKTCMTFLLLCECCTSSTWYHVFSFNFVCATQWLLEPICVTMWIPVWVVKTTGTASPRDQKLLSVAVKRSSSQKPCWFPSTNELMYRSKVTLNVGPQDGIVASRLLETIDVPGYSIVGNVGATYLQRLG